MTPADESAIAELVARVLEEDVGSGDLTAALIARDARLSARIVTREPMVLAGIPWADRVLAVLDTAIGVDWRHRDGDAVEAGGVLARLNGPAAPLLTAERAMLNLLQTLSATATVTARYVDAVRGTGCRILDTRKTLPGLRAAQKYAVRCGGGDNHRLGLYVALLIKENHIAAAGGIGPAIARSRDANPQFPVEIEVETLEDLGTALEHHAERVLLDNFSVEELRHAVGMNRSRSSPATLEASGNVTLETVRAIAETGVDDISVGALTKHLQAIDLSMRFEG